MNNISIRKSLHINQLTSVLDFSRACNYCYSIFHNSDLTFKQHDHSTQPDTNVCNSCAPPPNLTRPKTQTRPINGKCCALLPLIFLPYPSLSPCCWRPLLPQRIPTTLTFLRSDLKRFGLCYAPPRLFATLLAYGLVEYRCIFVFYFVDLVYVYLSICLFLWMFMCMSICFVLFFCLRKLFIQMCQLYFLFIFIWRVCSEFESGE